MAERTFAHILLVALVLLSSGPYCAKADVITRLPVEKDRKAVALTFDACETRTPSYFDKAILGYLVGEKIPFTLFLTGRFAKRNAGEVKALAELAFVEIENHSVNHVQHMEGLQKGEVMKEIDDDFVYVLTGKRTRFFRFPAGNYDSETLKAVEEKGYRVVHWSFESGDPDKNITPERLADRVIANTKSGDILIFHINGRGYSTGEALPEIVRRLKESGFSFVRIDEYLK